MKLFNSYCPSSRPVIGQQVTCQKTSYWHSTHQCITIWRNIKYLAEWDDDGYYLVKELN